MKNIFALTILVLLLHSGAFATTYYVSASGSNGDGKSQATAWQTLAKLNASWSLLTGGDSVLLHRGETFYGTITPTKSGTSSAPIVIAAYGTGSQPVVTSFIQITSWPTVSGNKYTSAALPSSYTDPEFVRIDGKIQPLGRWPNASAANRGYFKYNTPTFDKGNFTYIQDTAWGRKSKPNNSTFSGGEIAFRQSDFKFAVYPLQMSVTGTSPVQTAKFTLSSTAVQDIRDGNGYFIQNHIDCLDSTGEWSFNKTTRTVSVYYPTSLTSHKVEISTKDTLINLNLASYITVDGIYFYGSNERAVYVGGSNRTDIIFKNCNINITKRNAVKADYVNNLFFYSNTIDSSFTNAFYITQDGAGSDTSAFLRNTIKNTFVIYGMNYPQDPLMGYGVSHYGSRMLWQYNKFFNSGYTAIDFEKGNNQYIYNNVSDGSQTKLGDGGAIYTNNQFYEFQWNKNRIVKGNFLYNTDNGDNVSGLMGKTAFTMGFYADLFSTGIQYIGNFVKQGRVQLYMNDPTNMVIKDNVFYNWGTTSGAGGNAGIQFNNVKVAGSTYSWDGQQKTTSTPAITGNSMSNNVFFNSSTSTSPPKGVWLTKRSDTTLVQYPYSYGSFNNNFFVYNRTPLTSTVNKDHEFIGTASSPTESNSRTLPQWVTKFGYESSSKLTPVTPFTSTTTPTTPDTLITNETESPKTTTLGGKTWVTARGIALNNNTLTLAPYTAEVLIYTGVYTPNKNPTVSITSPSANQQFTAPATVALSATASDPDGTITQVDFYSGSMLLKTDTSYPYSYSWLNVPSGNFTLTAKATDNSGNVTVSDPIQISVLDPVGSSVVITSPAANQQFIAPATINISATATGGSSATTALPLPEKPDVFLSPLEMTATGGSGNGDNYALNTSGAKLTKTISLSKTGTYRVDMFLKTLNGTPIVKVDIDGISTTLSTASTTSNVYSAMLPSIVAGSHTLTISLTNYSAMASVGLIYLTQSSKTSYYVYPSNSTAQIMSGQILEAKHFKSGILRGFNLGTNVLKTNSDMLALAKTGANLARCWLRLTPSTVDTNDYVFETNALTVMDNHIALAEQNGFYIIPTLEVLPEDVKQQYWGTSVAAQTKRANISKIWKQIATRYKGRVGVAAYDLLNEPRGLGGYNNNYAEVLRFEQQMADSIRSVDKSRVIAIEVENNDMLGKFMPLPDTNFIYSPHGYNPGSVTHQGVSGTTRVAYPGTKTIDDIASNHVGPKLMASRFHVPIWYGEFSCLEWAPINAAGEWSATRWTKDQLSLVDPENFSWCFHAWREYEGWEPEISPAWWNSLTYVNAKPTGWSRADAIAHRSDTAPTLMVIKEYFKKNTAAKSSNIVKVDFYNGSTLLYSDTSAPYGYTWQNVPIGNYTITAKSTDLSGVVTTSGAVAVSVVSGNNPPNVTLTAPVNGTKYTAPASVALSATASDVDGTVSSVKFYNGSTQIGIGVASGTTYTATWSSVPAGNYNITATATDNLGATRTTPVSAITVGTTSAPTVSLTNPINGASYYTTDSILLAANASDVDGTIDSVVFYVNGVRFWRESNAPYEKKFKFAVGKYTITAIAYDNSLLSTTSGAVSISVINVPVNQPPSVSITAPLAGASYTAPATVDITATATDDGSIARVFFYSGSTQLGVDSVAPYTYHWTSVAANNYNLTAKAVDNLGLTTTSASVPISVTNAPQYPSVSLTSPANNAIFTAPASVTLNATASDPDGTIKKVEFYRDSVLLFTDSVSSYSYTWAGVATGTYKLTAKAFDNSGLSTVSGIVNITVNPAANVKPTVSITAPSNNSSFTQPVNLKIVASASDADGTVTRVNFYDNDVIIFSATNPLNFSYTYNSIPSGPHAFTAVAVDDKGDSTTSSVANVTIVPANLNPTAIITAPSNGASYLAPATVNISVSPSDPDGKVMITRLYNGVTLLYTDSTGLPFTYKWVGVLAGSYSLSAIATDNQGATGTSQPISISVRNLVAPQVSITSPANNASFLAPATISITATASDPDGTISKVEFYRGTTLISTDISSPYTATASSLAAGNYQLTAKAYDNDNQVTTSAIVNIVVAAPKTAPSVSMTAPANNSSFGDTASINLAATASDLDGTVTRVDFYDGATFIASDFTAPYTAVWSKMAAGTHLITAKAIDNDNLVTTSAALTINIVHKNILPTVSIISPLNNATVYSKDVTTITATATDIDGTITKVEFYVKSTLIGTSTSAPYTKTWSAAASGAYTLTVKAYDNNGGVTTSAPITVNVANKPMKFSGTQIIIVY